MTDIMPRFAAIAFGAAVVWGSALAASAPVEDLTVSQWADKYRQIAPESGARFPGQWRTDRVPYTREIMDTMGVNHESRRVFVRAGAQGAKTQCMNNAIGFCIDIAPRTIMLVAPSGSKAKAYNREQFQPMVTVTKPLLQKVQAPRSKSVDGSTSTHKAFTGGYLKIVSAQTESDLQSSSIGLLVHEEIASYPRDLDGRGDPVDQARERQSGWGDEAKEIGASTTGEVGNCRITEEYEKGDQRRYYSPCPHCDHYSELAFDNMRGGEIATDGSRADPYFVQPCCGTMLTREDLPKLLIEHPLAKLPTSKWPEDWETQRGAIWLKTYPSEREDNPPPPTVIPVDQIKHWRSRGSEGRDISFHFWQAQSPFSSWSDIWKKWEATKADPEKLVSFYQQVLALPYEPAMDRPKVEQLVEAIAKPAYQRVARVRRSEIPEWAWIVCGSIDTQVDRLDCATWAFGPAEYGEASPDRPAINAALIDWETINVDPQDPRAWAEASAYRNRRWPGANCVDLTHEEFGVDTGGLYTTEVYSAVAQHSGLRALKGSNQIEAMAVERSKNRVKIRKGRMKGSSIDLFLVGGHNLKKRIYYGLNQGLASQETGRREPGAIFLPPETPEWVIKQMTIEFLKSVSQGRNRVLVWDKPRGSANEHLDLAVYSFAMATMFGMDRFTMDHWQKLANSRHKPDVEIPPMEQMWSGNGDIAPDEDPEPAVVARERNPSTRSGEPEWLKKLKAHNQRAGNSEV